jgi:hypothetical protein
MVPASLWWVLVIDGGDHKGTQREIRPDPVPKETLHCLLKPTCFCGNEFSHKCSKATKTEKKDGKQPQFLSIGTRLKKLWCFHTMEYRIDFAKRWYCIKDLFNFWKARGGISSTVKAKAVLSKVFIQTEVHIFQGIPKPFKVFTGMGSLKGMSILLLILIFLGKQKCHR